MILYEQDNEVVIIRQTDHALLSGFFAREWGNELFSRPEPFESFRLAAAEHDNGWQEWEIMPKVDPATFLPYSFMSIPTEAHIALYQQGLERILKVNHYAALLVSMHCALLYDRARSTMPGYSAKYVRSSEAHMVSDFVQRLTAATVAAESRPAYQSSDESFHRGKISAGQSAAAGSAGSIVIVFLPANFGRLHD